MKKEKSVILNAAVFFLFCLSAMFSLSSCSKQSGTAETQLTPSPADSKMEGNSGNWKVQVGKIEKIAKEPLSSGREVPDPLSSSRPHVRQFVVNTPRTKFDTLDVTLDATYTGSSGNIDPPVVVLVNDKGQKFETLTVIMELTPGAQVVNLDDPASKEIFASLAWFKHSSKQKTRTLKSGEKFTLIYTFEDPKEYANLNLLFSDVPPLPLKVPQDEKGGK